MARKKTHTTHHTFWTVELQNIVTSISLTIIGAIILLSTQESSILGQYFAIACEALF